MENCAAFTVIHIKWSLYKAHLSYLMLFIRWHIDQSSTALWLTIPSMLIFWFLWSSVIVNIFVCWAVEDVIFFCFLALYRPDNQIIEKKESDFYMQELLQTVTQTEWKTRLFSPIIIWHPIIVAILVQSFKGCRKTNNTSQSMKIGDRIQTVLLWYKQN